MFMKVRNAIIMALLIGLSPFGGIISSTPVSADSAAGGNDAADSESTATVIPSENTWYNGSVHATNDEGDYYYIDVDVGETMEFEVIGPSTGSLWFYYKLNGSSWTGIHELQNGNTYAFAADNTQTHDKELVMFFQANQNYLALNYRFI